MPRARLTERDQRITAWLARWQPVTAYQVARRFDVAHVVAYRRLRTLRDLGYVQHRRPVQELPGIYFVTNQGYGLIGIPARAMRTNPFQLWGWLAAVDDVVAAELDGATVIPPFEVLAIPGLREGLPTIAKYDEPVLPETLAISEPPVATYTAIGPGGLLTLSPKGRLGQLAVAEMPTGTRVRLLTDATLQSMLELSFASRDVAIVVDQARHAPSADTPSTRTGSWKPTCSSPSCAWVSADRRPAASVPPPTSCCSPRSTTSTPKRSIDIVLAT
jgi:hypothetical protein